MPLAGSPTLRCAACWNSEVLGPACTNAVVRSGRAPEPLAPPCAAALLVCVAGAAVASMCLLTCASQLLRAVEQHTALRAAPQHQRHASMSFEVLFPPPSRNWMLDAAGHVQHHDNRRPELHGVQLLPREPAGGQPEPRLHLHPDGAAPQVLVVDLPSALLMLDSCCMYLHSCNCVGKQVRAL